MSNCARTRVSESEGGGLVQRLKIKERTAREQSVEM